MNSAIIDYNLLEYNHHHGQFDDINSNIQEDFTRISFYWTYIVAMNTDITMNQILVITYKLINVKN